MSKPQRSSVGLADLPPEVIDMILSYIPKTHKKKSKKRKSYYTGLTSLPNELIEQILMYSECSDILSFSVTCSRFHQLVTNSQMIWRNVSYRMLPRDVFKVMNKYGKHQYYKNLKEYYMLKWCITNELLSMSPKLYGRDVPMGFHDLTEVFRLALSHENSYYYTVYILCEYIKTAQRYIEVTNSCSKPYSMTEIHYARGILKNLMHAYLMVKWMQMNQLQELMPERMILFFVQWVDTVNIISCEEFDESINALVKKVEALLKPDHPLLTTPDSVRQKWANSFIKENMWTNTNNRAVLTAVAHVLFKQKRMTHSAGADVITLDPVKVINNNCGDVIVVAAIFESIARRCGVRCDLIVFSNHLYLEWKENLGNAHQSYTINLVTGDLQKKRRCPFSQNSENVVYKPSAVIQYLLKAFHETMGVIQDWTTQNVVCLLNFFGRDIHEDTPYTNMIEFLQTTLSNSATGRFSQPFSLNYITAPFSEVISGLTKLNPPKKATYREVEPRPPEKTSKYAIGMICSHAKYEYVCVVRGWENMNPSGERRQNVYQVIATDYSERFVPEENLQHISEPNRLHHLEDLLAPEFTHFDGFAYIPNDLKMKEYPSDMAAMEFYKNRNEMKRMAV